MSLAHTSMTRHRAVLDFLQLPSTLGAMTARRNSFIAKANQEIATSVTFQAVLAVRSSVGLATLGNVGSAARESAQNDRRGFLFIIREVVTPRVMTTFATIAS